MRLDGRTNIVELALSASFSEVYVVTIATAMLIIHRREKIDAAIAQMRAKDGKR
jgi:hypothetical protein